MTSPVMEKPCLHALLLPRQESRGVPDVRRAHMADQAQGSASGAMRRAGKGDERPNRGCFFRMPDMSASRQREPRALRQEALLQLEIAVRLYGYAGAVVTRHGPRDDNDITCIRQACQRLGIPLLVQGAARPSGLEPEGRSARNAHADSLVFRHGYLCTDPRNARRIEPGRDVSDTIRRLSDHMAPRVHDQ